MPLLVSLRAGEFSLKRHQMQQLHDMPLLRETVYEDEDFINIFGPYVVKCELQANFNIMSDRCMKYGEGFTRNFVDLRKLL